MAKKKKSDWEPHASGAILMLVWQVVFLKVLGVEWFRTLVIGLVTAILFFLVSVLIFRTSEVKGKI